jgi:uncharacterized protein
MRIVADTNTVVSGLLWQGAPRRVLDAGRNQQVTLITSPVLLAELAEVIGREKFAARIRDAKLSAKGLVEDYATIAHVVEATALAQPVSRDPDDDQVLACALAAKADAVVSGDGDLLTLGNYQGIPILTASHALEKITRAT